MVSEDGIWSHCDNIWEHWVTLNRMLRVTSTSEPTVNSRVVSFCLKVFSIKLQLFFIPKLQTQGEFDMRAMMIMLEMMLMMAVMPLIMLMMTIRMMLAT